MSSSHLLSNPASNGYYRLSSRASSATLFLSRHIPYSQTDGATDLVDMSVAQGLLHSDSPRVPRRRSSFNYSAAAQQLHNPENNDEKSVNSGPSYDRRSKQGISSNTWTTSSGEGSEGDISEDRTLFVDEFNKLAKKHGVQSIVPDEYIAVNVDQVIISARPGSWIMRKLLKRTSSLHVSRHKNEKVVHHKRSVSELSLRMKLKKDPLKDKDPVELVRLCGVSPLYLPAEYAAGTLAVPTCFRATAQYLVQYASSTRGIFRVPGAHSTVNALYNHYASQDEGEETINGTVRCPTLPEHIHCSVHDVASAFKRFLAGLPGGILGKAWLFNAFISIYNQLDAEAEMMRTKQSKVRARLIALAIATVTPRYRREIICAVLGLLSMIGRAAETAPREDEHGRPLPTSDLMGYGALGIVFGPLLVGDLFESLDLRSTAQRGSLTPGQRTPAKPSKGKHKKSKTADGSISLLQGTDKIRIVNSITEMLITHWRDVVRHMKNLDTLKHATKHLGRIRADTGRLPTPLPLKLFVIRQPKDWETKETSTRHGDRSRSPTPSSRNGKVNNLLYRHDNTSALKDDILSVQKRKPRPISGRILSGSKSMSTLAPLGERISSEKKDGQSETDLDRKMIPNVTNFREIGGVKASPSTQTFHTAHSIQTGKPKLEKLTAEKAGVAPRPDKQDSISIEADVRGSNEALKDSHLMSRIAHRMFKERYLSWNNTKMNATIMQKPGTKQIKASPFHDRQNQSEDPSSRQDDFSQVLTGIVSSRLRGIAASDPGLRSASAYSGVLNFHHAGTTHQKRRPNTTTADSHAFERFAHDPISRVSREEDLASLASLAEVIQSQDETGHIRSLSSVTSIDENRVIEPIWKKFKVQHQQSPELREKTVSPASKNPWPLTPRRSVTESRVLVRSGSVKMLATQFGNLEMKARQTPSPRRTPDSRAWHGSLVEKAVVAPYTVNSSPVPMAPTLTYLHTSLQALRNPVHPFGRTGMSSRPPSALASLLPKSSFSNPDDAKDSGNSQPPTDRLLDRSPRRDRDSDRLQVGRNGITSPPFSSNLHRTLDGNISSTLSRTPSLGMILPSPHDPAMAGSTELTRHTTMYKDHYSSSFDFSSCGPFVYNSQPCSSIEEPLANNQSDSILDTQTQHLSRQVTARTNEADHLRRLLLMKDSLGDPRTLDQLLREAKRESDIWRTRAEAAEQRLEILSHIYQMELDQMTGGRKPATNSSQADGEQFAQNAGRSNSPIRKELHAVDGISGDHDFPESEGTVWHASERSSVSDIEPDAV